MKILFIEDSKEHIGFFKHILWDNFDANVTIKTNMADSTDTIDESKDINEFDLVICDHNFPEFEEDRPSGQGHNLLFELVSAGFNGHFLHFSADPCPNEYDLKDKVKFHSLQKESSGDCASRLIDYIKGIKK